MSDKNQSVDSAKYVSERFNPKVPTCGKSTISLLFNGKELIMSSGINLKKTYKYPADSGKPNHLRKFIYSKERQKTPYKEPIPEEKYWIKSK